MPANAFELFMAQHAPLATLVDRANEVLWAQSALDAVLKERVRIALAEVLGCSYCTRFRTDLDGVPILGGDDQLDRRGAMAVEFARAVARNEATDELAVALQEVFSPEEFADLVFSIGWFAGMQHVGRLMHWDDSCPVAQIRTLVESGDAE
jgi:alkylhydroperoxidase family enzyme